MITSHLTSVLIPTIYPQLAMSPDQLCTDLIKNVYSQIKMREEPENETGE